MAAPATCQRRCEHEKSIQKSEKTQIKTQSSGSATEAETEAVVMKMEMVKSGRGTSFQNLLQRCL